MSEFEVRENTGTDNPLTDAEIRQYREEINRLDKVIIDAVQRRSAVSNAIGKTRMASGGMRVVHSRELAIIAQYGEALGREGQELADILLRLGRGRLG